MVNPIINVVSIIEPNDVLLDFFPFFLSFFDFLVFFFSFASTNFPPLSFLNEIMYLFFDYPYKCRQISISLSVFSFDDSRGIDILEDSFETISSW